MKKLILSLALICAVSCFTGCGTPNQTAYKVVVGTQATTQTALGAWNAWVGAGKATVAQEIAVRAAFQKVQASMLVVCDAGTTWSAYATTNSAGVSGATAAYQAAIANFSQSETDMENLIKSFGVTF